MNYWLIAAIFLLAFMLGRVYQAWSVHDRVRKMDIEIKERSARFLANPEVTEPEDEILKFMDELRNATDPAVTYYSWVHSSLTVNRTALRDAYMTYLEEVEDRYDS